MNPYVKTLSFDGNRELLSRRVEVDSIKTLDTAVTVEGQHSNQSFDTVTVGTLSPCPTIISLKLMGYDERSSCFPRGVK